MGDKYEASTDRPNSFCLVDHPMTDPNGHRCNDPKPRQKKKKTVKWSKVWFEFTQNTSFHGVCQVAEPQPFLARRLIWFLIFLGGTIVFLIHSGFSIRYYFAWPVSVDVQIHYNKTIQFPAITICNENAFRATEAYYLGQYDLITELFTQNRESAVDVHLYNASHISLQQLYMNTKHEKEDLIFKCEWDSSPCSAEDFSTTLTDYGVCYTFNDGRDGKATRVATQTGAQGGLRLQLNIEQYEYMRGPNDGAGVKLLVHQPHDIPLVKDHGLAVPSGMHAFVALEILAVHNLKPPHGKCNDSVVLEHFEHYTMSTCAVNCKQKHLTEQCGCRDIYMPPPQQQTQQHKQQQQQQQHKQQKNEETPVCDLETFQNCMLTQLDHFHKLDDACECPVPCDRVLFEPRVSYVSTSNFDTDNLLDSNVTDILEERYVRAREAGQRTQDHVVRKHNRLVHDVRVMTESIDEVFQEVVRSITDARSELDMMIEKMKARVKFHLENGLNHVNFVLEHDFVRGWQVYEERVLRYVSSDFINIPASVKRTVEWMNATLESEDAQRKQDAWWPVRNVLEGRLMLIQRARANITTAHEAYKTGDPLLTYEVTVDEHYDLSYISLELLQKGARRQQEYFDSLMKDLDVSEEALNRLIAIGETFVTKNSFDAEEFLAAENHYFKGCRGYNYRLFLFKDRIIMKPLHYIKKRITKFMNANDSMIFAYADLISGMDIVMDLIRDTNLSHWRDVQHLVQESLAYERDTTRNKTYLAQLATSVAMAEHIRQLKIEFAALRSRAQELSDNWRRMTDAYQQMWVTMVSETSTKKFYEMLHHDAVTFAENTMKTVFHRYFADLLGISRSNVTQYEPQDLTEMMNADFHTLNLSQKVIQIEGEFWRMESSCKITDFLGDQDEKFLQSFENLQTSLRTFLDQNVMNQQFYRENFLQLDVFMQELSYEEITMQPAYDLPQLLGDIGGSMGLFIGGSALSVFEFFDVIIHNGARLIFNK